MPVRYRNGLKLMITCHRCGARKQFTVYQQRIRWIGKANCGHTKHLGYTMPVEELKKKGLLSGPDPAVERARKQAREDFDRQITEKMEFIRSR